MPRQVKCSWIMVLLVWAGTPGVQAATVNWTGGKADANNVGFWDDPGNWDSGSVPTADDAVQVYQSGATAVVDDFFPEEKVCDILRVGWNANHQDITVKVIAGTFRSRSQFNVGLRGAKNCTFQMDGGHVIAEGNVRSARDGASTASFIINGGTMEVATTMALTELAAAGGAQLTVNGGTLTVGGALNTGQGAPVTIALNGGTVHAGALNLSSGASLEIKEGVLVVQGDIREQLALWAARGQVTGFGIPAERGSVQAVYNAEQDRTTVRADIGQVDLNKAWNPAPIGAGASLDAALTWSPGDSTAATAGHDVYLGEDPNAVANDTAENVLGAYRGRQDGATYAIPFELVLGRTYFWRIDQVDQNTGAIHPGSVWSFTAQPFMMIEGFDTYPVWSDPDWQAHLKVWQESGGAASYIVDDAAVDVNSIEVDCHPDHGPGDAVLTLPLSADWTHYGIRALNFMFKGHANLSALKVTLGDDTTDATVTITDENILRVGAWRAVDIDLAQFAGVDLSQIRRLSLGAAYTGEARINYDRIRVFPSRCVADYGPEGDLNGDCIVDAADLEVLAADWLKSGYSVVAAPPGKAALVHYNMDQAAGTTVTDAMGLSDATLVVDEGSLSETKQWDPSGGINGSGCLAFDGHLYMDLDAPQVFATVDQQLTITLWVRGDADQQPPLTTQKIVHGWMAPGWGVEFKAPTVNGDVQFQAGVGADNTLWQGSTPADWEGGWTHYALVKDAGQGIQRIYRNGELMAENVNAFKDVARMTIFTFGGNATTDRGYAYRGRLDDIQIYDVALPQSEALYLAGRETLEQSVFSPADLNGDNVVDQADRDILEANLGTEKLWP